MDGDDDFHDAMSDVVPLKVPRTVRAPPPRKQKRVEAEQPTIAEDPNKLTLGEVAPVAPHETLAWKQDGVQDRVFRKLKNGEYDVQGELDLHRKTVREARVAVYDFLKVGLAKGWRTVLIAHGRGEKSPTPARIKSYVATWLRESPDVIAFHSALPKRGGTGAVYALLKKSAAHREENRERHGLKSDSGE
jgi:DNA-nicking Smr family endonuclease